MQTPSLSPGPPWRPLAGACCPRAVQATKLCCCSCGTPGAGVVGWESSCLICCCRLQERLGRTWCCWDLHRLSGAAGRMEAFVSSPPRPGWFCSPGPTAPCSGPCHSFRTPFPPDIASRSGTGCTKETTEPEQVPRPSNHAPSFQS